MEIKPINSKNCRLCNIEKSTKDFEKTKQNLDGFKSYCRICRVKYDRLKRIERKAKNPEKYKKKEQERKLIQKYNINKDQYNKILKSQNYCCYICEKHMSEFSKSLYVDHCHTTGKVRGLLCNSCNKGLGDFKDNTLYLLKAIKYLEKNDKFK